MSPNRQRALVVARLVVVGAGLLVAAEALARVGGGEGFGSGGGGGGGGGYSGGGGSSGGGDGLGLLLWLLIRLCVEYPAIGIPLVISLVVIFLIRGLMSGGSRRVHSRSWEHAAPTPPAAVFTPGLEALREKDAALSIPVLVEFVQLVHRRALSAAVSGEWAPLRPFVGEPAQEQLARHLDGVTAIHHVVHAGTRVERFMVRPDQTELHAMVLGSRREARGGTERSVYFEERWVFRRDAAAVSLPPEETLRLGCPSCGAAVDTDRMGRCVHCETPITKGQLAWQVADVASLVERPFEPMKVGPGSGGDEPSVRMATRLHPRLHAELRALQARHPDFEEPAFVRRVAAVYLELQQAWSDRQWDRARPFVTDPMYQNLRFYMEQYAEGGLFNRLGDVRFIESQVVKVELDAWYEAITVRIWGSMRDWVETADGKVVGGNKDSARRFSEYWTFLRAAGTGANSSDSKHCPSCGAPLDNVNQAGVCGYCDSRISSGRFDWVLSRIDQAETYQG